MKRPQFGLRLLMLLVALAATTFAWIRELDSPRRMKKTQRLDTLQTNIRNLTAQRDWLQQHPEQQSPTITVATMDEMIGECQEKLIKFKAE